MWNKKLTVFAFTTLTMTALVFTNMGQAWAQTDLGLVGVKSVHARYLQAYTNGTMHGSNEHRNEEETWHLVEVDKQRHIYALLNWNNHRFMSKKAKGCVRAVATTLSPSEQWVLVSGKPYGVVNAVAFKSVVDGTFMGTNDPGKNTKHCGGEVTAQNSESPPQNNGEWPGWWVLESVGAPERGRDFWNTTGRILQGIVSELKPADVAALIGLLAM
jgi:hypothetical protein